MQKDLNMQIVNATKWSVFAEVASKLITPIVNIILARLLTPDEFGIVASITIITSFADIFTDAGFQKYVIQHEFCNDEDLNKYSDVAFTSNVSLSVLIYIIIFVFRNKLAEAVGCPGAYTGLAIASLTVLCTSFSSIAIARFRKDLNFKPLFYIRLGSTLIPLLVTVPLAIALRSYWAIVIGTLSQQLFIAVLSIVISKYKPRIRFNKVIFVDMVSFSLWNLFETLSIWFAGQANIFIVVSVLDSFYLGLYKTGMSTINSYMGIITAAITPVLFSALSRAQNDKSTYNQTFNGFQKSVALLVIPMGAGIFLYRSFAVQLLLGSQWMQIADFMGLWALMSAMTITFSNTACEVYRSMGKPKISFILQMIYLCFYVPSIYFSANSGDFRLLCIVSCLIRLLPITFDLITLRAKFDISMRNMIRNTGIPFVATGIMIVIAIILRQVSVKIVWNLISIVICIIVYFGVVLVIPSSRREVKNLARRFRTR